jgi:acyl carrier protein
MRVGCTAGVMFCFVATRGETAVVPIDQRVLEVFRRSVSPDLRPTVSLDSHLHRDLGLSSYDYMTLLDEVESEMGVEVDLTSVVDAQTVADVVAALAPVCGADGPAQDLP